MSGVAGMVNLDGAPVDAALLERMTASLDFRGPDARQTWISGQVGFGHTLLRTTFEAEHERQPFSFDGRTFIVADCRIDAREALVGKLQANGRHADLARPDVELILHAWHVWRTDCVHHLLGDFAFAVWDAGERRLFCARDHLGVKPLYYAQVDQTLVFSNTLDCVRLHPGVRDDLNDLAVVDFLVFGVNQDTSSTTFNDIRRLRPAQTMLARPGRVETETYWTLPVDPPIYYRAKSDYAAHFTELLSTAVRERIRTPEIGIFLSGGLDSSTLAAACHAQARQTGSGARIELLSFAAQHGEADVEYAALVAEHLGLPLQTRPMRSPFSDLDLSRGVARTPEPCLNPTQTAFGDTHLDREPSTSRVWLFGEGPDNALLFEWKSHLRHLLRSRRLSRAMRDMVDHALAHRRLPVNGVRAMFQGSGHAPGEANPAWLSAYAASIARPMHPHDEATAEQLHPVRPVGYRSFSLANWQQIFERCDAAFTRSPREIRHPYLSLPLLRFMLAVPGLPWCRNKFLIRQAMRGQLPPAVLKRPKTPLAKPDAETYPAPHLAASINGSILCKYLVPERLPPADRPNWEMTDANLSAYALLYWLRPAHTDGRPRMNDRDTEKPRPAEAPARPYEPPELICYGTIAGLTNTVGKNGSKDGGNGAHGKTQP